MYFEDEYPLRSEPITIGGPAGLYKLSAPLNGATYYYRILNVAAGAAAGTAIVGTAESYPAVPLDGSATYNDTATIPGTLMILSANASQIGNAVWLPMPRGKKQLFTQIAVTAGSIYVTIQFAAKPLTVIPAQPMTTHEDTPEQIAIQRSEAIRNRLDARRQEPGQKARVGQV